MYTERPVKSSEDEPSVESVSELVLGRIKERECRHEQQTRAFVQFFTKQCFVTVQQQFFVHVNSSKEQQSRSVCRSLAYICQTPLQSFVRLRASGCWSRRGSMNHLLLLQFLLLRDPDMNMNMDAPSYHVDSAIPCVCYAFVTAS